MNIMGTSVDGWLDMTGQVAGGAVGTIEGYWRVWVDCEELFHVKNLNTVVDQLASNNHVVLVATEFFPARARIECCIRCTKNIKT